MSEPTPTLTEPNSLAMRLAVVYYTPLGWDLLDGDDVDPDDLAQCLQAMRPVVAEVETILAAARADERERLVPLVRRAVLDPGAFIKRGPDYEGEAYGERLDQWQDRAIQVALAQPPKADQ